MAEALQDTINQVRGAILSAFYRRIVLEDRTSALAVGTIRKTLNLDAPRAIIDVAIADLVSKELLTQIGNSHASGSISPTIAGLVLGERLSTEKGLHLDSEIFEIGADTWRDESKATTRLSYSSIDQIKGLLGECIQLIAVANLSQQDRAQVQGLLKICDNILDLPTPKLSLLREILLWIKEIPEIAESVQKILDFFR
ncbi:hypothetical protein [Parvibaculum sp.]|uniref:hypothetical protein n=1 Tax=Parvibaculum sp. TaxID=2024848 RepID=UPI002732037F|nr:hypothetical protein [Parvibaculum sp.]MDP1626932.1 hypothetical protein [Parvibaculum sp.]MDP2151672.1 hypothetical protein [Parvibaculum sp.]MDP3328943.1 hypothetical protein [Parvibaculum sp.]